MEKKSSWKEFLESISVIQFIFTFLLMGESFLYINIFVLSSFSIFRTNTHSTTELVSDPGWVMFVMFLPAATAKIYVTPSA